MSFKWKGHKDIWKGEGIYHLTFVVKDRRKLLGEVCGVVDTPVERALYRNAGEWTPVERARDRNADGWRSEERTDDKNAGGDALNVSKKAWVELSSYGRAVDDILRHYDRDHEGITVCTRMVMDDHIHVVLWVRKNLNRSILQIAYGMRVGFTHLAQDMGIWPKAKIDDGGEHQEKGIGHVFERQYVRTLVHKGQLQSMIEYVQRNPYRRWMKRLHPDLFSMHKDTWFKGLRFRSMGNHWLLNWPIKQIVECSRNITVVELDSQMKRQIRMANDGAVTYSAAISEGERKIIKEIRMAHMPVVILLKDGFPAVGSENEKYFKPGGVYFDLCSEGKLLLLEAYPETYENEEVVKNTEEVLRKKAEARHLYYQPLPHTSLRWKFMAGNTIVRMLCE